MSKLYVMGIQFIDDGDDELIEAESSEEEKLQAGEIRRLSGCQSEHKGACQAPLWTCEKCGKVVCCVEGNAEDEMCDDCWAASQVENK